jgi:hypothetical protein
MSQHAASDVEPLLLPPPALPREAAADTGDAASDTSAAPAVPAESTTEDAFASLLPPPLPPLTMPGAASGSVPAEAPYAEQPAAPIAAAPPPQQQQQQPSERECCVCLDSFAARELRVLVPCGHRTVCADCAAALLTRPQERRVCPECRGHIASVLRVYD